MNTQTVQDEKISRAVSKSVKSGVKPFSLVLTPVYNCYSGDTLAYKVTVTVNSLHLGALHREDIKDLPQGDLLCDFDFRIIKKVLEMRDKMVESKVKFDWLGIDCDLPLLEYEGLYETLKALTDASQGDGENIVLFFDSMALENDPERLQKAFGDIRSAGFGVGLDGYGGVNFPLERLMQTAPDKLITASAVAGMATDRERKTTISPLVAYGKCFGCEVYVSNVKDDNELREFRSRECDGFLSKDYHGAVEVHLGDVDLADLIARSEGNV